MEDKLALVTGASSGIGFELAKELANRGYDVVSFGHECNHLVVPSTLPVSMPELE
jgi:short-subunit dehydrogenase